MKLRLIIPALLLCVQALAQTEGEGRRIEAGPSFLEPLQRRDSILVWDHFHYGVELKDIPEGTPISLPSIDEKTIKSTADRGLAIIGGWELDSVKVSSKRDSIARYDIRAYISVAPEIPGQFELFELECKVGKDTLVFIHQMMDVKEPSIDLETFQPNDIKPQVKFPITLQEIAPWGLGIIILCQLIWLLVRWLRTRKKEEDKPEEPAHIRALRKLDKLRGDKFWKPEHQKAFYSGVTDALREYIAARFGVGAMEMTTAEIFDALKGTEDIPADLYKEIKELFEVADFVKFAKLTVPEEDNKEVLPKAVRFVTDTYQAEIAGTEGDSRDKPENDVKEV
ncbi:MAG: hypothetical protein J5675_05105 [Bacteroidales bacterium]|nr:hypothetical protein [Bacteroidales bacterium]